MNATLIDFRFCYNNQNNPFKTKTESNIDKLQNFMNAIYSNESVFQTLNWIEESRYFNAISKTQVVFGQPIQNNLKNSPKLCIKVVESLDELESSLKTKYSKNLRDFVSNNMTQKISMIQSVPPPITEVPKLENVPALTTQPILTSNIETPMTSKPVVSFSDINIMNKNPKYSYDLSTGKTLTYHECVELILNKARSNLSNKVMKDENILFIEEREKSHLRLEIKKYVTHNEKLRSMFPSDNVENLSLKELQTLYDDIKNQYEFEKLENVIGKSCELVDLAYNSICPNGIKIPGKNKAIKLNGLGESFQMVLNDRSSTTPIAFKNLQKKYGLKVADEADVIFSIVQSMIKNISIVDYKPENKQSSNPTIESVSASEYDSSDDDSSED